jgi:hypothetical protein
MNYHGSYLSSLESPKEAYLAPSYIRSTPTTSPLPQTPIFSSHENPITAANNLQNHLQLIEKWMKKWKIKVNETKSVHMTFTLKKGKCPPIRINNIVIHQKEQVKYLGITLDSKLTWKLHLQTKRKQLELKFKELYWLLGKKTIPHNGQQIANLQNSIKADLDVRHTTLGMLQQNQPETHTNSTI